MNKQILDFNEKLEANGYEKVLVQNTNDGSYQKMSPHLLVPAPAGHVGFEAFNQNAGNIAAFAQITHPTVIFDWNHLGTQNYNPATGIFTAPKVGLYVFNYSNIGNTAIGRYYTELKVNGVTVDVNNIFTTDYGQNSVRTRILSLNEGDEVSVVNGNAEIRIYFGSQFDTMFSGYILM